MIRDIVQAETEEDINIIRFIFPEKKYVDYVPRTGDGYIIKDSFLHPNKFRAKFQKSVLIHPAGVRLISEDKETGKLNVSALAQILKDLGHKNTKVLYEIKQNEMKEQLINFLLLGELKKEEYLVESMYKIMLALGNPAQVVHEYFEVDMHYRIKISLIMKFIYNAFHIDEVVADNGGKALKKKYKDDLDILSRKIKMPRVKQLLLAYMKSPKKEIDALDFIMKIV